MKIHTSISMGLPMGNLQSLTWLRLYQGIYIDWYEFIRQSIVVTLT